MQRVAHLHRERAYYLAPCARAPAAPAAPAALRPWGALAGQASEHGQGSAPPAAALLAERALAVALAWFAGPAAWYGRWSAGEARCAAAGPRACARARPPLSVRWVAARRCSASAQEAKRRHTAWPSAGA